MQLACQIRKNFAGNRQNYHRCIEFVDILPLLVAFSHDIDLGIVYFVRLADIAKDQLGCVAEGAIGTGEKYQLGSLLKSSYSGPHAVLFSQRHELKEVMGCSLRF